MARSIAASVALGCVALLLSGCSAAAHEPVVQPSTAKQSVIGFAEESATAAGGHWERASGPGVRECEQASGAPGTTFVYIIRHVDTDGADASADVRAVSKQWQDRGIAVDEYQSGGPGPVPGVRGRGGPVVSASFDAYPGNYRISVVSKCSDGMPDQFRLGK
jgi:hypothetical protein